MINEKELRKNNPLEMTLEIPAGEDPVDVLGKLFGCAPTPHSEMPSDADVDETYIVKLR